MKNLPRRKFIGLVGAGALSAVTGWRSAWSDTEFRVRTITAGVKLRNASDLDEMYAAVEFLSAAGSRFSDRFEIQTTRIATQPLPQYLPSWLSTSSSDVIRRLDQLCKDAGSSLSIGPILIYDEDTPGFASWAADLIQATTNTSFSCFVASQEKGLHHHTIQAAAEAIVAIAQASAGGEGNFRFCATAFCPPGTPFFPAAYHEGRRSFSIGLESPRLLQAAVEGSSNLVEAERSMRSRLNGALAPVEALAEQIARETGWLYLGVDTSPAPGLDASIGEVIETLAGTPFGSPSTLSACSTITDVLKGLDTKTCGYSGLMLPVLEDRVLAKRAIEGRYGVSELLLYSSVCGTGLDVVPLPGDAPVAGLAATIEDVAALAARYHKPLSARLFPVPGKQEGDMVNFDNPYLTQSRVLALG